MWLVHTSDTRHEGETVLARSCPVSEQCHSEFNGGRRWGEKKEVRETGQGGCETGEQKGFPSYCFITLAGTAAGAAVSL